jgi:hypothetical protein
MTMRLSQSTAVVVTVVLLVCSAGDARAQYRVTDESLGGYFKLVVEGLSVRGDNGLVTGLGFGFVFDQKTYVGLGGYGLFSSSITTSTLELPVAEKARLYLVWGGLEIEHAFFRSNGLRAGVTSFLGIGNVEVEEGLFGRVIAEVQRQGQNATQKSNKDSFYLFDPGAIVSYTPASWIQVSARAAYRIAFGVSYLTMSSSDISGFAWGVRISLGSF